MRKILKVSVLLIRRNNGTKNQNYHCRKNLNSYLANLPTIYIYHCTKDYDRIVDGKALIDTLQHRFVSK